MNIFVLDEDATRAAEYHADQHVNKMIVETSQILSFVHANHGTWIKGMYKPAKAWLNHPCTLWAGETTANYDWTYQLLVQLIQEFFERHGGYHACCDLFGCLISNPCTHGGLTDRALSMPNEYKDKDPVVAYRAYYIEEKIIKKGMSWTKTMAPEWAVHALGDSIL